MFKLVVLFAAVACASAAPSGLVAPVATSYAAYAPAVHTYAAAATPVVAAAAPVATAVAVESPTVVQTRTSIGYAQGAALSKQVHYAPQPVVTGYSSSVIKPDLGALATPLHSVVQQRVLAPSRAVQTITPEVTHVQPVAVPVEVEVRTPQVVAKAAPVIAAPAVHTYAAVAPAAVSAYAAPAVSAYAAPAVTTYAAGIPAVQSLGYGYGYGYAAAPALYKY